MTQTRNVAILIFDDVEVLDFSGPFEVFSVAGRNFQPAPFNTYTVASSAEPVLAKGQLSINPHYTFTTCPLPHILLVPGGWGTRRLLDNGPMLDWIVEQSERVEYLLSVCTGSLLLGRAGLLDGLGATTHHTAFDLLRQVAPTATIYPERRYVDNGRIVTSSGISAGIDMALYMVAKLLDQETAQATADYMEYRWLP